MTDDTSRPGGLADPGRNRPRRRTVLLSAVVLLAVLGVGLGLVLPQRSGPVPVETPSASAPAASTTPSTAPIAAPSASASAPPDPDDDAWLITGAGIGLVRLGEVFPFAALREAGLTVSDPVPAEERVSGCVSAQSPDGWTIVAAVGDDHGVGTVWLEQAEAYDPERGGYLLPLIGPAPALADGTSIGSGVDTFLAAHPDARSTDGQGRDQAGNGFDDHAVVLDGTPVAVGAAEGRVDFVFVGVDHVPFGLCV